MRTAYAKEPAFLSALQRAEVAWLAFRDAQVKLAGLSSGGTDSACAQRELAGLTSARTVQLREWLTPRAEGDACDGSYGRP